jgi:hypothetical protein
MRAVLLLPALWLGGCTNGVVNVDPPNQRCMRSPQSLTTLKPGDDLVEAYAELQGAYKHETNKQRCLQRWTKTVLGTK